MGGIMTAGHARRHLPIGRGGPQHLEENLGCDGDVERLHVHVDQGATSPSIAARFGREATAFVADHESEPRR